VKALEAVRGGYGPCPLIRPQPLYSVLTGAPPSLEAVVVMRILGVRQLLQRPLWRAGRTLLGRTVDVGNASVDEPEIAYELLQRAHGCGYATEAARAVLEAAIATGRTRLWSTVRAWNAPSFRVLEKLGFDRDHVWTPDDRGQMVWMTRALP
jgi:GNAT superfamily N-acetyltransferase